MKYLLDTNVLIWLISGMEYPSLNYVYELQNDDSNHLYYSIISVWEVAIKHTKNSKLMEMTPKAFVKACNQAGIRLLELEEEHVFRLDKLELKKGAPGHKDPFDRMLMAQAKYEKMTFITGDAVLKWYKEENMIFIDKG